MPKRKKFRHFLTVCKMLVDIFLFFFVHPREIYYIHFQKIRYELRKTKTTKVNTKHSVSFTKLRFETDLGSKALITQLKGFENSAMINN